MNESYIYTCGEAAAVLSATGSIVEVQKKQRVCPVEAYQDPNANMDKTTETWESFKQAKAKQLEDLQQ
jgi:hypothetical protein